MEKRDTEEGMKTQVNGTRPIRYSLITHVTCVRIQEKGRNLGQILSYLS